MIIVLYPQLTEQCILEKTLFPLHPFQQTMVQLIPNRTDSRIPELVIILNDSFDHWIQFTSQIRNRLTPFVDLQPPKLPLDGRFRSAAHKCPGHKHATATDLTYHRTKRKAREVILSWIALLAFTKKIHYKRFDRV